jgi:nucleotide-binding universal stress UspA family protein
MATLIAAPRVALRNILLATDFSACSRSALKHALNLTQRYGSKLFTVNVLPQTPFVESAQPDPAELRRSAESKMRAFVKGENLTPSQHAELIEEGEVPAVLSELVQDYRIDLVVLGTEGREGLQKFLLGSVAEEVFRTANCPVLTVGPHVSAEMTAAHYQHVLYATDFGVESLHALPYAVSIAEEHGARLTLLHVAHDGGVELPEPNPGAMPVMSPYELVEAEEKRLRELVPAGNSLRHEPEYMVQFGNPADTILRIAGGDLDLIVLGVKRAGSLAKHWGGSVAYRIVCEAHCPVLSVGQQVH